MGQKAFTFEDETPQEQTKKQATQGNNETITCPGFLLTLTIIAPLSLNHKNESPKLYKSLFIIHLSLFIRTERLIIQFLDSKKLFGGRWVGGKCPN